MDSVTNVLTTAYNVLTLDLHPVAFTTNAKLALSSESPMEHATNVPATV
jgi:hypothetical protein